MHRRLKSQLAQLGVSDGQMPTATQWQILLDRISQSYEAADEKQEVLTHELAHAADEHHQREAMHHMVARHFPNGALVLLDKHLRITFADGEAFRQHQVAKSAFEGKRLRRALPLEVFALLDPACRKAFAGEHSVLEVTFRDQVWECYVLPIASAEGVVHMAMVMTQDVTQRKQFEAKLVEAKEQAEAMAKLKTTMLANMSHEIRTPLTTILGFASVLAEEATGELEEFAQMIYQSSSRLMDTLRSVLDLAQLESESLDLDLQTMDLGQAVENEVRLLRTLAEQKNLVLDVDLPDDPIEVQLDRTCLSRIIHNLVSNAVKFTEEGHIAIRVSRALSEARIQVQDTGTGIDEAFMPALFETFKQESSGIGRMHEGIGLGLAITKRLVDIMNGHIEVESTKGAGTTFTITFPLDSIPDPEPDTIGDNPVMETSNLRLLVVEDQQIGRILLRKMLGKRYEVDVVGSSDAALTHARTHTYDAILLDINLSEERTGVDVLKLLRKMEVYENAPIIALTAYALPGDRERLLGDGFDDYVGKPFTKQDLFRALDTVQPRPQTQTAKPAYGLRNGVPA